VGWDAKLDVIGNDQSVHLHQDDGHLRGGATRRWTGQGRDPNKRLRRVATVNKRHGQWRTGQPRPQLFPGSAARTQLQSITAGRRAGVIKRS